MFFRNRAASKPRAVAFVDYEHWFISLNKMYHIKPDIRGWVKDMSNSMDVKDLYFFGDFSNNATLRDEITKIRGFTSKIIETGNASGRIKKDFTDFIMLDHIYQEAMARRDHIDVFILFTGDAHFNSAASFLRNICKKEVGIYGIRGGFSNQLKTTASWWVEYPNDAERLKPYFQVIFTSLDRLEKSDKKRKALPTFIRTVETVSTTNNLPRDDVRQAMQWLVDNGYILRRQQNSFGKKIMTIDVDWHKVVTDGLWTPEALKK